MEKPVSGSGDGIFNSAAANDENDIRALMRSYGPWTKDSKKKMADEQATIAA